ncbi:DUF1722 domain-containing protein [Pseudomonas sp. PDM15]|jgi:uncharacterized protein YbgA (DUF1722 family)/uncharacterized protein YbbK (DUF523 family)|uniref:YbgA family protein n=1 Tax=Pseudomonas sp. PDM15 TaxID=2769303 RepID=UPI0017853AF3|nr:DUF523 and DUF1722 domain-containing protein [Pseudomonas sp. PDM15]MBD9423727.1 DUF1722 domain-containing protein [Pseudomonas sp. PDM15]
MGDRLKLGISACLLGERVRYNGGHKRSALCTEVLTEHFELVPVCPEVAIGLGTPRPAIRLVGDADAPRALVPQEHGRDLTAELRDQGARVARELDDISGFVLMHKSPSCGLHRVKLYRDNGHLAEATTRGVFAASLHQQRPELPLEDEGRLHDPVLRENFLNRVFVYGRWQRLLAGGLSQQGLLDFHARHKYLLMATHPQQQKALGRLLSNLSNQDLVDLAPRYFRQLMDALSRPATRGTHSNVLQHLSGHLKQHLGDAERTELQRLIEQYRTGVIPLVVPLTLLRHHFNRHPDAYVANQDYLQPYPDDLSLRNAI